MQLKHGIGFGLNRIESNVPYMSWLLNDRTLNVERHLMDIALAGHLGLVGLFQLLNEQIPGKPLTG